MRASADAELHSRVQAFVPTFRAVVAALDALQAERDAAKAAPVPPAPAPSASALPHADLQAVQQALAAANGHVAGSSPPPAAPRPSAAPSAPEPDDQQTGFCSIHQVPMEQKSNERGTWYSHWLRGEQQHCKGRRPSRR